MLLERSRDVTLLDDRLPFDVMTLSSVVQITWLSRMICCVGIRKNQLLIMTMSAEDILLTTAVTYIAS